MSLDNSTPGYLVTLITKLIEHVTNIEKAQLRIDKEVTEILERHTNRIAMLEALVDELILQTESFRGNNYER